MGIIKIKLVFILLFYICLKIYEVKMGIKIYKLKIKLKFSFFCFIIWYFFDFCFMKYV